MEDYKRNPHSVTLLNYHFVWCPKRRKAVLKGDIKLRAPSIIFDLCQENNWRLIQGKSISIRLDKRLSAQPSYSYYPWPPVYFFVPDYVGKWIPG
jgi:putative transposase